MRVFYANRLSPTTKRFLRNAACSLIGPRVYYTIAFRTWHGYWPRLSNPLTFNAKILWHMLYANVEPLKQYVDKLAVRDFVASTVGEQYLIPLLWSGSNADEIPQLDLPNKFVIKPNHGSHWVRVITDKNTVDWNNIIADCKSWLGTSYYTLTGERIYKDIHPTLMVESLLADPGSLIDFKFLCFDGRPLFIDIHGGRFTTHCEDMYDLDWNWIPVRWGPPNFPERVPRPACLDEMVEVAKALAIRFSFVRVDLYEVNGHVYFGELTFFPSAGRTPFDPVEFDHELGKYLRLERNIRKA